MALVLFLFIQTHSVFSEAVKSQERTFKAGLSGKLFTVVFSHIQKSHEVVVKMKDDKGNLVNPHKSLFLDEGYVDVYFTKTKKWKSFPIKLSGDSYKGTYLGDGEVEFKVGIKDHKYINIVGPFAPK